MECKLKKILLTGAAGFIGFHVIKKLLELENYEIIGIDNLNNYYDVNLKKQRILELKKLDKNNSFSFHSFDIIEKQKLIEIFKENKSFDIVINLAAQASVRYSLTHPDIYIKSNVEGFLNILECCRYYNASHLIYASSSSVYGNNKKLPFNEDDTVDHPISLYAATKKSNELMAHTYSHLFNLPVTGLRFFTVYGPWGRPDMALYLFAEAILNEKSLNLFNEGNMLRDFTYVEDVSESIVRLCGITPTSDKNWDPLNPKPSSSSSPYKIYNIGNHTPILVKDVISKIENYFGKKAIINNEPIQPGDVYATYADVKKLYDAVQFQPKTSIDDGLVYFLNWFSEYNNIKIKT
ncbi:NAD-dependent epimerase/dehydratase family protein [Silvanigrella paludirubra]